MILTGPSLEHTLRPSEAVSPTLPMQEALPQPAGLAAWLTTDRS